MYIHIYVECIHDYQRGMGARAVAMLRAQGHAKESEWLAHKLAIRRYYFSKLSSTAIPHNQLSSELTFENFYLQLRSSTW